MKPDTDNSLASALDLMLRLLKDGSLARSHPNLHVPLTRAGLFPCSELLRDAGFSEISRLVCEVNSDLSMSLGANRGSICHSSTFESYLFIYSLYL